MIIRCLLFVCERRHSVPFGLECKVSSFILDTGPHYYWWRRNDYGHTCQVIYCTVLHSYFKVNLCLLARLPAIDFCQSVSLFWVYLGEEIGQPNNSNPFFFENRLAEINYLTDPFAFKDKKWDRRGGGGWWWGSGGCVGAGGGGETPKRNSWIHCLGKGKTNLYMTPEIFHFKTYVQIRAI